MGFSWTTPSSGGESIINDSTLDQIQTHLVTLFGDVDYDRPTCSYEDINADDHISNESLAEMKEDIILADEMNTCRTHYTDHRSSDYATYDVGRDLDHNDTEKTTHYSDENSDYNATQRTTHYTSRLATHNITHNSTQHVSVDSGHQSVHLADHHGTHYNNENLDAQGANQISHGGGLQWSNMGTYDWAVQTGVGDCEPAHGRRVVDLGCGTYQVSCGWKSVFNPDGDG
jgi:hypothetical protein